MKFNNVGKVASLITLQVVLLQFNFSKELFIEHGCQTISFFFLIQVVGKVAKKTEYYTSCNNHFNTFFSFNYIRRNLKSSLTVSFFKRNFNANLLFIYHHHFELKCTRSIFTSSANSFTFFKKKYASFRETIPHLH